MRPYPSNRPSPIRPSPFLVKRGQSAVLAETVAAFGMAVGQIKIGGLRAFPCGKQDEPAAFGFVLRLPCRVEYRVRVLLARANAHQPPCQCRVLCRTVIAVFKHERQLVQRMHITRPRGTAHMPQIMFGHRRLVPIERHEMGENIMFGRREAARSRQFVGVIFVAVVIGKTFGLNGLHGVGNGV